jgi:uncharacterized protein (DUF1697 family)
MTTYIGLLRAVNVGGRNKISMAALRELVEQAGYSDARTYVQSGNVVFTTPDRSRTRIESTLERELAARGLATPVMVRTGRDLQRTLAANPFPEADPKTILVVFLKEAASHTGPLDTSRYGPEQVHASGRELFVRYPNGVGRSKLTPAVLERAVGTPGTGRNWNTVNKLAEMALTM